MPAVLYAVSWPGGRQSLQACPFCMDVLFVGNPVEATGGLRISGD